MSSYFCHFMYFSKVIPDNYCVMEEDGEAAYSNNFWRPLPYVCDVAFLLDGKTIEG
jgi:hypothetical protein